MDCIIISHRQPLDKLNTSCSRDVTIRWQWSIAVGSSGLTSFIGFLFFYLFFFYYFHIFSVLFLLLFYTAGMQT